MKYNDFLDAQGAWAAVQAVVDQFRYDDDVQIVAETGIDSEYWLMQKFDGQTEYLMTWCYDDGVCKHEDVKFNSLEAVERWLFEQYTDGNVTDFWCEGM